MLATEILDAAREAAAIAERPPQELDREVSDAVHHALGRLVELVAHNNLLPHHTRAFTAGQVTYQGCDDCALIAELRAQLGLGITIAQVPTVHTRQAETAAFVPPEESADDEEPPRYCPECAGDRAIIGGHAFGCSRSGVEW